MQTDNYPVLLKISQAFTAIQDRKQLFRVILEDIKTVIPFDTAGLFIINQEENLFWELLEEGTLNDLQDRLAKSHLLGPWPFLGNHPDSWIYTEKTTVFEIEEQSILYPNPQWELIKEAGLQELVGSSLKIGSEKVGLICFLNEDKGKYSASHFNFIDSISTQLAVVLSNILAQEKIIREKSFKEKLLSISEAVASIQDRKHLLKVIFQRIRPILAFDSFGLFVLDDSGKYHYEIIDADTTNQDPAQVLVEKHLGANTLFEQAGSAVEEIMTKGPSTFQIKDLRHPQIQYMYQAGLRHIIGGPLKQAGTNFGMICFSSNQEDFYSDNDLSFFKAISEQIAVAVSNILVNEKVLQEKQFKEKLLSISEAIANIQDRKHLLKVIYECIKPVFSYDEFGLFVVDKENDYHYEIIDAEIMNYAPGQVLLERHLGTYTQFKHAGSAVDKIMKEGPKTFLIKDLLHLHPHAEYMLESGLQQLLGDPLRHGGEDFGMICFNAYQEDFYSEKDILFFKAISEQISVAVNNVLANEKVLQEKSFKEQLLSISEAIASIKDRKHLLRVIYQRIKPVFPYDEYGLFVLDSTREYHYEIIDAEMMNYAPGQVKIEQNLGLGAKHLHRGSGVDEIMDKDPNIYDINYFLGRHPQIPLMKAAGIQEIIAGPLKYAGEAFGVLAFTSYQKKFYTEEHLPFFKAISEQMSVAVKNVLANEEIQLREQEKTSLLEISELLAEVRNREELLQITIDKIKTIFPFKDVGLLEVLEDGQHRDLVVDEQLHDEGASPQIQQAQVTGYFSAHPVVDYFLQDINITDAKWLIEEYPNHPHYPYIIQANLAQVLAGPMLHNGKAIGVLCFWSDVEDFFQKEQIPLFKQIINLMATTLANVLANEAILQEKQYKEDLLSISEAIATIQSKDHLSQVIYDKIKPILPFDSFGLIIPDASGEFHIDLAIEDGLSKAELDKKLREINVGKTPKHPAIGYFIKEGPLITAYRDLMEKYPGHPHYESLIEADYKQIIGGKLQIGGKTIGMLCFNSCLDKTYTAYHLPLFQSISEQIAVALSNVLANEDIQRREKENILKIALSNAITEDVSGESTSLWEQKLFKVASILKPEISFEFLQVLINQVDGTFQSLITIDNRDQKLLVISQQELSQAIDLHEKEYISLVQQVIPIFNHQTYYSNEAFKTLITKYNLFRTLAQSLGIRSTIFFPVAIGGGFTINLNFYRKNSQSFFEEELGKLERIKEQLKLSLQNLQAFHQIAQLSQQLKEENTYLREEVQTEHNIKNIIGRSLSLQRVFDQIQQIAPHDSTVLILGETGTGKELVARAIHNESAREKKPLIKVNCAALPEQLIESELFGHEKGAFTGALQQRIGKFELAHQGTIFLDEIGELPLELQGKLLRVLQEKEFERLGGNKTIRANCRIIAATNRNLKKEVAQGNFREDLFYRLSVFPLEIPPLRDRRDDVSLLIEFFAQKFCRKMGKKFEGVVSEDLEKLAFYDWPGNVRELENLVEHSVILHKTGKLHLSRSLLSNQFDQAVSEAKRVQAAVMPSQGSTPKDSEREHILQALQQTNGRVSGKNGAAKLLGVKPSTLEYRIKKYQLMKEHALIKAGQY